jgi:helix-turn-helix protein
LMGDLRMSVNERNRLEAFGRVKRGELTVVSAAGLCGLSLRQGRRVWKRFKELGDAGLVHRLRGRASNRRMSEELRQRIVKRHQERYADFGPTLACEKLAEELLLVSPDTLVALLKERGLWVRQRRRGKHRKRRERRSCLGSMVQMDGSHHDWFEGRSGKCVLMVLIDDATSLTYACFYAAETTEAAFDLFRRWIERYGIPRSVYVDRHSIYRDEDHAEKPTQFGRAMKELSVELICAHSPQAKGRVERRNAVFQDRLVKEMRLRNIRSMDQGNALLEKMFLADMNQRYAVKARKQQDLHRPVDAQVRLEDVLCVQEERVVGQDWCVRWRNRWLQIQKEHAGLNLANKRVRVKQRAGGELIVEHKGQRLTCRELSQRPTPARSRKKPAVNNRKWKPSANHPWNRESVNSGPARRADPPVTLAPATPARELQAGRKSR